jgi:hypothetical protein
MNTKTLWRGIALCALTVSLAGCIYQPAPYYAQAAYQAPPTYYAPAAPTYYAPAAPAYYAPAPYYAPAFVGPSVGFDFAFGGRGGHHFR